MGNVDCVTSIDDGTKIYRLHNTVMYYVQHNAKFVFFFRPIVILEFLQRELSSSRRSTLTSRLNMTNLPFCMRTLNESLDSRSLTCRNSLMNMRNSENRRKPWRARTRSLVVRLLLCNLMFTYGQPVTEYKYYQYRYPGLDIKSDLLLTRVTSSQASTSNTMYSWCIIIRLITNTDIFAYAVILLNGWLL